MKNWQTIMLPQLMQGLEKDERGVPIPYIVLKDRTGKVHFKVNDSSKITDCITNDRCHVCGNKMEGDTWLIGGPKSAFHPAGAFVDAPVHKACGTYSLQVCPYLAYSGYNSKETFEEVSAKVNAPNYGFVNFTQDPARVPFFVFIKISSFDISFETKLILPRRPYLDIEFWNDGEKITEREAIALIKKSNQ